MQITQKPFKYMTLNQVISIFKESSWSCMHAYWKENITRDLFCFRSLSSIAKSSIFISHLGRNCYFCSLINFISNHIRIHHETDCEYFCTLAPCFKYHRTACFRRLLYSFTNKLICSFAKYYLPYYLLKHYYWCSLLGFWSYNLNYGIMFQRSYSACFLNR